ncbi:MAG: hypothetical protein C5B57_13560 [Blastocatellia bacterium]|nr:MAG: hypothetical protein C5B57_13560 [Blastocatellia bacterium]
MSTDRPEHSERDPRRGGVDIIRLSETVRRDIVERKATCPFLGAAIATGVLAVRNDPARPLASIDDVIRLGNSGGGNLGEVLAIFAQGNHAFMPGPSGALDEPVPAGYFSLDLPGSQGSHPGHSAILQSDPTRVNSGRFSREHFDRLLSHATGGVLVRSHVAKFIANNVATDPNARALPTGQLVLDIVASVGKAPHAVTELIANRFSGTREEGQYRDLLKKLTKAAAASNLVGSCGEFGLLFAFLEHKPGARSVNGEPVIAVEDLTSMFEHKAFPPGWETWPKTANGWIANTVALLQSATSELLEGGRSQSA